MIVQNQVFKLKLKYHLFTKKDKNTINKASIEVFIINNHRLMIKTKQKSEKIPVRSELIF
ncbi:MAG: hypothetical protein A2203_06215 [Chromatiales bacterium RIFOXYA1_FULL_46_5]|nr:MAG: hypothetical protein A2203_06215 [Chromatiales bacterium RIFOXYA1_FULL_46_5]